MCSSLVLVRNQSWRSVRVIGCRGEGPGHLDRKHSRQCGPSLPQCGVGGWRGNIYPLRKGETALRQMRTLSTSTSYLESKSVISCPRDLWHSKLCEVSHEQNLKKPVYRCLGIHSLRYTHDKPRQVIEVRSDFDDAKGDRKGPADIGSLSKGCKNKSRRGLNVDVRSRAC